MTIEHSEHSHRHLKRPLLIEDASIEQTASKRPLQSGGEESRPSTSEAQTSSLQPQMPTPEPSTSKAGAKAPVLARVKDLRLPDPCPLPNSLTPKTKQAVEQGELAGHIKLRLLREASCFYQGICPQPTATEYVTMAKTLCQKYPQLQDKRPINGESWVSSNLLHACMFKKYFSNHLLIV